MTHAGMFPVCSQHVPSIVPSLAFAASYSKHRWLQVCSQCSQSLSYKTPQEREGGEGEGGVCGGVCI
jgi:hypothetical protein